MAGICLIRLTGIRPSLMPLPVGITSENAAHRIAVRWEQGGREVTGVYIPRRDTSSRMNALAGGRLFPGVHHHATFQVDEAGDRFEVRMTSRDGQADVAVSASVGDALPITSVFGSVDDASAFFESGSKGYSATSDSTRFDGLELRCRNWSVTPLDVHEVYSSFFSDTAVFPEGNATFDHALLMTGIAHEWRSMEDLCCAAAPA